MPKRSQRERGVREIAISQTPAPYIRVLLNSQSLESWLTASSLGGSFRSWPRRRSA
jgi:hypothetical protein